MKLCVSIPVHETQDVVNDLIDNIKAVYGKDVLIVLHRSQQFQFPDRIYSNRDYNMYNKDQVLVNPVSLPTRYHHGLAHVHNANFRFASQQADFDTFILHASNDMYVRKGAGDYIRSAKNACMQLEVKYGNVWGWSPAALEDAELREMMNYMGLSTVYSTQPEGIFFEKEIFREMVSIIDKFFEYGRGHRLPREEIFYPTLVSKLTDRISHTPLVLSEITTGCPIDEEEVIRVHRQHDLDRYPMYNGTHLFAVKRVERNFDHPLRAFIRNLMN